MARFTPIPESMTGIIQTARDIQELTEHNYEWLRAVRPDTLRRHRNLVLSSVALRRAVRSADITTGVLRSADMVAGIGTIVSEMVVENPRGGTLRGRQIDLWLDAEEPEEGHMEAVRSMATYDGYEGTVIATMTGREIGRALGVPVLMDAMGYPGNVNVLSENTFGLDAVEESVQIYAMQV